MRILIVYGTTEGHTRELCRFIAHKLSAAGHQIEAHDASEAPPEPSGFDAVILAGSLHLGRYQAALTDYARERHAQLDAMASAFVSVSLSAAGVDPNDWAGLGECLDRFERETLWRPRAVCQAAGAIRYSRYDYFKGLAIRFIAERRGVRTVASRDYDLTDYAALERFALEFARSAEPAGSAPV
jgi:menaquinone-dependent protoporphyrinogen oxidase